MRHSVAYVVTPSGEGYRCEFITIAEDSLFVWFVLDALCLRAASAARTHSTLTAFTGSQYTIVRTKLEA